MEFTKQQLTALQEMVKNFKCPVCGNTHLKFEDFIIEKPLYSDKDSDPEAWIKVAVGKCTWCGLIQELDLEKIMESYSIMTKK